MSIPLLMVVMDDVILVVVSLLLPWLGMLLGLVLRGPVFLKNTWKWVAILWMLVLSAALWGRMPQLYPLAELSLVILTGVAFGLAILLCWYALRFPEAERDEGRCATCGYNLTGNTSGVCPECGTELTDKQEIPR